MSNDGTYDQTRDWFYQNVRLMEALTTKGYDINYAWGMNRHGQAMGGAILPDMMRWLWRDQPVSTDPRDMVERSYRAPRSSDSRELRAKAETVTRRGTAGREMQAAQPRKPALGVALRLVARRRDRPDPRARDAVRLRGPATGARPLGQHEPLQSAQRRFPGSRRPLLRRRAGRRLRRQQEPLPIGMSAVGKQTDEVPPMVSAALAKTGADGKPVYVRGLSKLNDTADPVALIRNALSAQADQNAAVVLAGLPVNLVSLVALPDGREWAARKARVLSIAGGRFDTAPPIRSSVRTSPAFGSCSPNGPRGS